MTTILTDREVYVSHLDMFLGVLNLAVVLFDELPQKDFQRRHIGVLVGHIEVIQKHLDSGTDIELKAAVIVTRKTIQQTREILMCKQLPEPMRPAQFSWMQAAKSAVEQSKGVGRK